MDKNIELLNGLISKRRYAELLPVLNSIQFPYAILKGEPLSIMAYNKTAQRISSDIDILIRRDDLNKLEKLLLANGFKSTQINRSDRIMLMSSSHQVSPWVKEIPNFDSVNIDLNFDIFWGEYTGNRVDIGEFLSDTESIYVYGYQVKTLPPIKAMIQLILHHYKEMNSIYLLAERKCVTKKMFSDVYHLFKNNDFEIENFNSICQKYNVTPYAYYILFFTNKLFPDNELLPYIESLKNCEGEILLDCYGLCEKERKKWKYSFEERLDNEYIFPLIKDDLTESDLQKIEINKQIFG